ncbi:acyl-CoA dehydrogenase [Nocardioides sp. MAH-18]|uniref:Acyl-CoA dehydrogenase n=1 Tax=Nocardioides agri TaxID=2682843 RepID=A0A6L6XWF5_9ACTN|nr:MULTISPECIES: acyl-CoA dehydrogenase family protein [unclassified Nocardioides]MBA2955948.1 acyl-CoA dehydrogenase family protein [Nocardioides sp. CGMCC 1.13656]MVQ50796.1 acyl-CoA dehydrogenase [Nocardioides sp. MAH-18]
MDFNYDEEQQALREAVRGLVGRAYSDFESRRRTVAEDPGFSEKVWTQLAEMGILGLPFDEEHGGMGAGAVEIGIVAQELGRVLAPEPFLTSVVLAGGLVAAAGSDEQKVGLLGDLSSGASVLAFAHAEPGSRWQPTASAVTATQSDDGWTLAGVKEPVLGGARADLLIVSAALPDGGTGLFVVTAEAPGLTRDGYRTHDGGRAAKVTFADTPADLLGDEAGDRSGIIARVLDIARIAACNEAVGAMEFSLETTAAYLKSRKQFGVPLNTFQALTFRAADMYVSLEQARSLATWASMVLDSQGGEDAAVAAARASLGVSRAGRHIGQEAIQLHGGIGMTAEYSIGSYTSRLTALDHLLGDGNHHLGLLAANVSGYDEVDPLP